MIADVLIGAVAGLSVFMLGYIVGTMRRERSWRRFMALNYEKNRAAAQKAKEERNARRREQRAAKRDKLNAQALAERDRELGIDHGNPPT